MPTKISELPSGQNIGLPSNAGLLFSSTTSGAGSKDVGLVRDSAGNARVSNGSTGLGNLAMGYTNEAHTTGDTLTAAESNSTHTNTGAGGSVTIILPAATNIGCQFTFYVGAAQNLVIDAAGTDLIRNGGSTSTAGGTATNNVVGSTITLRCVVSGTWAAMVTPIGTWTLA